MTDIQQWLGQLGLQKYGAVFAAHEIAFEVLPDLTEQDIDRLALPTGPRRRLMIAIQALRAMRDRPSNHDPEAPAASIIYLAHEIVAAGWARLDREGPSTPRNCGN